MYLPMYVHMHMQCICMYVNMHVFMYVHMLHICMDPYTVYVFICVCMHIQMCIPAIHFLSALS